MAKINTTNYQPVTAWNGTQDLFIVEQPDGTKVATPEQIRQCMNAFMDDEPTEGSEEAVKSGGVFSAIENSISLKTATGNPINITDVANANAEELSMTIEPIQDLHGYSKPWPAGGGKNLLESVTPTETMGGITYTLNNDGSITCSGTYSNDSYHLVGLVTLPAGTYILSGCPKGDGNFTLRMSTYPDDVWLGTDRGAGATITLSQSTDCVVRIYAYSNAVVGKTYYPMIRLASETDPTFEPYSNICPISGLTSGEVETTDGTDTNTATISFGQTVYGGSVNFKTGEATVTHGIVDLGTLDWAIQTTSGVNRFQTTVAGAKGPILSTDKGNLTCSNYSVIDWYNGTRTSSADKTIFIVGGSGNTVGVRDSSYNDAAAFKTAMSGVRLCYELATPTTLTLTPAELELLKGNNTITANGAEISLSYYPDNAIGALAGRVDDAREQIGKLTTPTLIWNGYATDVGSTYSMTRNYTDFKYLLVTAKTNYEEKNILIPTSSISATDIYGDVLSTGEWNANTNAFTYNSSYGIKFTAANAFQLVSSYYNNANWVLRPIAIYGIG